MDIVYYVTHPRIDKTGVVYAPSTEKARTTFLDWLERNNLIRRSHRAFFRENMVAERIEDPNVPCDVILNYGYQDFTGRFENSEDLARMSMRGDFKGALREEDLDYTEEPDEVEEKEDLPSVEIGELATETKKRMPIQEIMLRGYVE